MDLQFLQLTRSTVQNSFKKGTFNEREKERSLKMQTHNKCNCHFYARSHERSSDCFKMVLVVSDYWLTSAEFVQAELNK